jgi:hypothetical protein
MNKKIKNILMEIDQRVCDMLKEDKRTGEHSNASPLDYVRWAIEEVELNIK